MDLALRSATEQRQLLSEGQISARELLDACMARADRLDGALNAIVVDRRGVAQARAERLAARSGPLGGLVVSVKEAFDWAGVATTWGDPALSSHRAARDAHVVAAMIEAGANPWAKTNVALDLGDWQTHNPLFGATRNPWDLRRTCGGSSGGSAVAVAAGFSSLEVGSDIGGSIRFPAHYCGVFGHKPSYGLVSQRGHAKPHRVPRRDGETDLNSCGPLARSAKDLALALHALASAKLIPAGHTPSTSRVAVMFENPLGGEQDDEMMAVLRATVDALTETGVVVVDGAESAVDHARAQHVYRLLNHAATAHVDGRDDDHDHARRYDRGDRDYEAVFGKGSTLSDAEHAALLDERQRFRHEWARFFESVDLVLCPTSASPAPTRAESGVFGPATITVNGRQVSHLDQWFWAGMASGALLPATVAPCGLTASGLPVGLQIVAPFGHDLSSIAMAGLIEELRGGFIPAPLVA